MAPQPMLERAAIETRIRGEFNEMPGLCLTLQQARRLWALDDATCGVVLEDLLTEGFLRRSQSGVYLRSDHREAVMV
ncbi:MAG TPA: hypothetical protein VF147_00270 [Vicinamibacterales bacterium]